MIILSTFALGDRKSPKRIIFSNKMEYMEGLTNLDNCSMKLTLIQESN